MKEILLSSALVMVLVFTGCDDDKSPALGTTSSTVTKGSVFTDVGDINVTEGSTDVATFKPKSGYDFTYAITGGADAEYFMIEGNKLKLKSKQKYLEGDNNSYIVEVTATDTNTGKKAAPTKFTINIVPQAVIITTDDTTAPVITTPATNTIKAGESITLTATDASAVRFSEDSVMFTISGTTLTPEFSTGTNSVVVTATDTAGNSSDKNITVIISAVQPPVVEANTTRIGNALWSSVQDDRFTWEAADLACKAKGTGWSLPTIDDFRANSDAFLATIPFDTDGDDNVNSTFTSALWSASLDNNLSKMRIWSYNENPADDQGAPKTEEFFFTCIKK